VELILLRPPLLELTLGTFTAILMALTPMLWQRNLFSKLSICFLCYKRPRYVHLPHKNSLALLQGNFLIDNCQHGCRLSIYCAKR